MRYKEIILFTVVITLANLPLLGGGVFESLIYVPETVMQGQWWRVVTHAFVHVSFYNLVLDGVAFLLLYAQLAEASFAKRMGYLAGINAAVVGSVTWNLPAGAFGYCGLSGIAHGLMAVWCLERMSGLHGIRKDRAERWTAGGVFVGLVVKSIYEVSVGHVFLEAAHLGDIGVPVVASHLAGVIGAVMVYGFMNGRGIFLSMKMKWKQASYSLAESIK